jgi:hypothetical protein
MKFCGYLKQNTAVEKLIGQLFSFNDGKTLVYDAIGGAINFEQNLIKLTLTKNATKSEPDLIVSGTCGSSWTGNYYEYGRYNNYMSYIRSDGTKFIWVNDPAVPFYIVSSAIGSTSGPYFILVPQIPLSPAYGTDYWSAQNGATGTLGIAVGNALTNVITLVSGGMAKITLSTTDTNTEGLLIISLENAESGNELIFVDSFYWIVLNETAYNQMFGVTALATAANLTTVDTVVDAIKTKTDNLPASPATEAKQDTIIANQSIIDTHVLSRSSHSAADVKTAIEAAGSSIAAIKAKTDNLPASPAAVGSEMGLTSAAVSSVQNGLATSAQISGLNNISAADVITALKNATGFTVGGTWSFAKIMKVIAALFAGGNWRLKTGETNVYEILDSEDGTTVVAEATISESGTILSMSVKI